MFAKDLITTEVQRWKDKGLTPSYVNIGPDIVQQLKNESGSVQAEILGVKVILKPNDGFFCSGPWYFTSAK